MKILILIREYPPYACGGMGRVVQQLEKFSVQYNLDLTIIANQPKMGISQEVKGNILIYRVPTLGNTFLTKLPTFAYFASQLVAKIQDDYDLIYSVSSPIFCRLRRPLVAHFQGMRYGEYVACRFIKKPVHAFLNKLYVFFDKILLDKSNGIIVLSKGMIEEVKKTGRFEKDVTIISNGVDENLFMPLAARQFSSKEKNVLYVGRLDMRKGIDFLIRALAQINSKIKVSLTLVGEGNQKVKLINLAKSLAVPIEFLGKVSQENLPTVYNRADLFVLPSLYEGVPLVALEAMACATPTIISTACPDLGIPRFTKGSVESLMVTLENILSHEDKLQQLSKHCYIVSREYVWKKIVGQIAIFLKKYNREGS